MNPPKFRVWLNSPLEDHYGNEALLVGWWPTNGPYWCNLSPSGELAWGYGGCPGDPSEPDVTVEFYTGLKDGRGVEIYKGDLMSPIEGMGMHQFCFPSRPGDRGYQSRVFLVKPWIRGLYEGEQFGYEGEMLIDYELMEIIGNIHDNPELRP